MRRRAAQAAGRARRRTLAGRGVVQLRARRRARETFTVRKQSFGVGVERTFPLHSPKIERIEVAARGDVRRAKLYYLRGRVGKRARVRERRDTGLEETVDRELLYGETAPTDDAGVTVEEAEPEDAAASSDEAAAQEAVAPADEAAAPEDESGAEVQDTRAASSEEATAEHADP